MDNKLVMISIAAVIGIIVLGSVLMPILDDATATTDTFTNEGYYHMEEYGVSAPSMTLFWDHTDKNAIMVGTEKVLLPTSSSFPCTLIAAEDWGLRYVISGSNIDIALFGTNPGVMYLASTSSGKDMTITLNAGSASFNNGTDTPVTLSYTKVYVVTPSETGFVVMKEGNKSVYLNGDSTVIGVGRSALNYTTPIQANIYVEGTINDGFSATVFNQSGLTADNFVVTYTEVSDHKDLYSFDSVKFDVTNASSETVNVTYSQVIVPYEVTAEKSEHLTLNQIGLLNVIPVLIIVAILIGIVALVIRSRMD